MLLSRHKNCSYCFLAHSYNLPTNQQPICQYVKYNFQPSTKVSTNSKTGLQVEYLEKVKNFQGLATVIPAECRSNVRKVDVIGFSDYLQKYLISNYRKVASRSTCYYSENQIFYSLE